MRKEYDDELEFESFEPKEILRKMFRWRAKYIFRLFNRIEKLEKEIDKLKRN